MTEVETLQKITRIETSSLDKKVSSEICKALGLVKDKVGYRNAKEVYKLILAIELNLIDSLPSLDHPSMRKFLSLMWSHHDHREPQI